MTLNAQLINKAKMVEVHRLSTLLQAEENLAKTFSIKDFLYRKVGELATDDALIPYLVIHNKVSKGEGESRKDTIECSWDDWMKSRKTAVAKLLDNSDKIPGDIHDLVNQYSVSANRRKLAKKHIDKGFCEAHLVPKYSGSKLYCQSGKYELPFGGLHWLVAVLSQHFYKMNRTDDSACRKMKAFIAKDFGVQDISIMDSAPEWVYAEIDKKTGKAIFTKDLFRLTREDVMEWTKEKDVATTRESTQSEDIEGNPILEFAKEIGHKQNLTMTLREKYTRRHWDQYITWYHNRSPGTGGRNSNRKVRNRHCVVGGSDRDTDYAAGKQKFGNRWAAFQFPNFLFFARSYCVMERKIRKSICSLSISEVFVFSPVWCYSVS
jgi:hypothetical protein